MASLFGLLNLGASALSVSQDGIGVHGNNVANAQTQGYLKRGLLVDEALGNLSGGGVVATGVSRSTDFVLSQRLALAQGSLQDHNLLSSGLQEIQGVLQTGQSTLSQMVSDLGSAFSQLAASPSDQSRRADVIFKGQAVAGEFNRVSQNLTTLGTQDRDAANGLLPRINDLAGRLAGLNARGVAGSGGGAQAPDDGAAVATVLDQRDQAAQDLAGLTGGQVLKNSDGTLDVVVGGLSLVHGAVAAPLTLQDGAGGTQVLVGGAQVQLQVGGQLGAALALVSAAQGTLSQFDQLAYDLASALNAQHSLGVGLDGVGGRPFFQPLGAAAGAANSLQVDPGLNAQTLAAGFTSQPGDNRNALALANLIDQPVLEGGKSTFNNVYSRIAAEVGNEVQGAAADASTAQATQQGLIQASQAVSGVNTDEEMTQLLAYQRSFEAGSKFVQEVDQMLSTLTNMNL